jgi:hypothetical protein
VAAVHGIYFLTWWDTIYFSSGESGQTAVTVSRRRCVTVATRLRPSLPVRPCDTVAVYVAPSGPSSMSGSAVHVPSMTPGAVYSASAWRSPV